MSHFTRAGELNPGFGNGGVAVVPAFGNIQDRHVMDIVMQGDNILVGVLAITLDDTTPRLFAMTRFTSEGNLDTTFGENGKVIGLFENSCVSGCETVQTSDDGSIWMLGWSMRFATDLAHIGLMQFDRDAKKSITHALEQPENTRLITQCSRLSILDNSVMATANFTEIDGSPSLTRIYRLDVQGSPGFGEKQYIDLEHPEGRIHLTDLIQQPHAFLIAGQLSKADGKDYGFIARYLANGTLDPTFANGAGFYSFLADRADTRIKQLILRPDGALLAIGEAQRADLDRIDAMVVQWTAHGSVDPSFNQGLPVFMSFKDTDSTYRSGALHENAQLTVAGHASDYELYGVRYNANGTRDTSFSLKQPLMAADALIAIARTDDSLIATNSTGAEGSTGMIFSFFNQ